MRRRLVAVACSEEKESALLIGDVAGGVWAGWSSGEGEESTGGGRDR